MLLFAGRVDCRNEGIVTTSDANVHDTEEIMADGVVEEDTEQDGAVPVRVIDEGICIFIEPVDVRIFVVTNDILTFMGEDTIDISELIVEEVSTLAVGVRDTVPVAILNPPLDISILTDLGEVSNRFCTTILEINSTDPVNIYVSLRNSLSMLYLIC